MTAGVSRYSLLVALFVVAVTGLGCGGGTEAVGSTGFDCGTNEGEPNVLCLQSCNLGCSSTGCAQTDIAQNEVIVMFFSEDVDPNSVNTSSIRFRTPSGDEPVGEFLVNDNRVEFVPTLSISGGQTFFGFTSGETYTMTIIGGQNQSNIVRGTSGRPFGETLVCTLQSSKGIIDLNGVPPSATLISPTNLEAAPLDSEIVLEFNELIDATPFLSGTQSPVEYSVRRTRPDGNGGTECDPASQPQPLAGSQSLSFDAARGVSLLAFSPAQLLPGNVCIEISVTNGVTDLSGRTAQPQVFAFKTIVVPLTNFEIVEEFADDSQLDAESSGGQWGGGFATFAQIGGDGRHGEFSIDLAFDTETIVDGRRVFELNTDNTLIPPENGTSGGAQTVTTGRYFFSKMVVPGDVRLRFVGTSAPVITVAGRFDIQGDIEVNGVSVTDSHSGTLNLGQQGAAGGIFGGAGGNGGNKCLGTGPGAGQFDGSDGDDVNVLGGHAYSSARAGTGGQGSVLYPASGLNADQQFGTTSGLAYCLSAAAGGSGGGLYGPGDDGRVLNIFSGTTPVSTPSQYMGPPAPAGVAFTLVPYPPATGLQQSSEHFLVGGAGGGGAASNCSLSLSLAKSWASGAGGAGGGGAMALRAGGSLRVAPTGRLLAVGGNAYDYIGASAGAQVAPAGGGSGGSIILQAAGDSDLGGSIDVRGGNGGFFRRQGGAGIFPNSGVIEIQGGNGGPGFVRFEKPTTPDISELSSMSPPPTAENVGALGEVDGLVSVRSFYYSTGLIFGPEFSHYVIEATVDGAPMVFSDDPTISTMPAAAGAPVQALWQAANLDVVTGEVLNPVPRPWRTSVRSSAGEVGIASDALHGYRFMLFADRAVATEIVVNKVTVVYRN